MTEVAVLVPVLGRPASAAPLVESFTGSTPIRLARLIFLCSPDDDAQIAACRSTGHTLLVMDVAPGPGDFARKVQAGFDLTDEPFVFQAADDVEFTPGWLENALGAIDRDGGYGVCGTNDLANPQVKRGLHSTHSLIRRSYVEDCGASWDGPGSVFSTAYQHQRVDNELVELAKWRGCFTFARDSVVKHHHPIFDRTVKMDDTYRRALENTRADGDLFHRRQREWQTVLK